MKTAVVRVYRMPREHYAFARDRVDELIKNYGQNITRMTIEQLAISCYAQGVTDADQALSSRNAKNNELPKV